MRVFLGTLAAVLVLLAGTAAGAAGQPSPQAALQQALNPLMADTGSSSGAYVVDLNTGQVLYSVAADTGRLPASVEKIYTTSTALLRLGPTATFATSILGVGSQDPDGSGTARCICAAAGIRRWAPSGSITPGTAPAPPCVPWSAL